MNLAKHDAETDMDMDMTPMIDVVFLLIIFFMVITDLTQRDLEDLHLPLAEQATPDKPDPDE
ncbi:MAG: biopolymer transporter ExbD, partial [Planctomycetota bacterium]